MARDKVPANRFQPAATTGSVNRIGSSTLAPNRYVKRDQYGFHLLRVLADGQEILYTVTPGGMGVEKINFVPSKERRDGNACYGNRWLGILEYRQSPLHREDFAVLSENGLKMAPEAKAGSSNPTGGWTAG